MLKVTKYIAHMQIVKKRALEVDVSYKKRIFIGKAVTFNAIEWFII